MTNTELTKIMNYLDAEFASGAAKMTNDDKIKRHIHWREEIGDYQFEDAMEAVREIAKSGFPPRTGQVRNILDNRNSFQKPKKASFRMYKDPSGGIFLNIEFGNGGSAKGDAKHFEPWEIIKWRAIITKEPANIADWDEVIYASEKNEDWKGIAKNIFQRMVAAL